MAKRQYRLVHDPLLVSYMMKEFPFGSFMLNVRLGKVKEDLIPPGMPEKTKRFFQNYQARADAVAFFERKVHIIECVVRPEWYKIEHLDEYEQLFKVTDRFKRYWSWPIVKILVSPLFNPYAEARAKQRGIKVVKYTIPGMEEYLGSLRSYTRTPRLSGLEV